MSKTSPLLRFSLNVTDLCNSSRLSSSSDKEQDKMIQISGFIFMCNGKTKPECYRYRVFGLPKGQKEIIEKIKPGTKLFLFDFEQKLLYGIYEATSGGELNLEQAAFDGKFPAQVKFKICGDYFPLDENALKHAIQHNSRKGSRFKQELNSHQVQILISLFRPISRLLTAPVASPRLLTLPALEDRCQPPTRLLSPEDSHVAGMQRIHARRVWKPHNVPQRSLPQQNPESRAIIGCSHPAMDPQGLPTQGDMYYPVPVQQPYYPGCSVATTPDPVQHPYVVGHSATPTTGLVQNPYFVGHSATPPTSNPVQHPYVFATPTPDSVQHPYFVVHSATPASDPVQHSYFVGHSATPAPDSVQHPYTVGHSATPASDLVQHSYLVGHSAAPAPDSVQHSYFVEHSATPTPVSVQHPYFVEHSATPTPVSVQHPYFVGHSATPAPNPYQRYGAPQDMVSHNQNISPGNAYYPLSVQGENQTVAWGEDAVQGYNHHTVSTAHVHAPGEPVPLEANYPSDPSLSREAHYVYHR